LTPEEREKFRGAMERQRCGGRGVEPGSAPA
jgi:hypothetical protein